jgi:hypothetical protein
MEFFERLYRGFEAEHYVAGKLFSAGYEAFMMPGDFGFDLMVTNQRERSKGPRLRGRLLEPPFAVQVKSRRLMSSDFRPSTSGREGSRGVRTRRRAIQAQAEIPRSMGCGLTYKD